MRMVAHAAQRPHRCAAIPFLSNHNSRGFFDTGNDLNGWDPHVYISFEAVEQMATMLGWVPKAMNHVVERKLEQAENVVKLSEEKVANLQKQLEAVETLRNAGFKARERKVAA